MTKTWYPVIDYSKCSECGSCVANCPHNVYDKSKAPSPVVKNPDACVDHCHGCGNRCPAAAITYVGDDTGWTPPHGSQEVAQSESGCSCGNSDSDVVESGCSCGNSDSADKKALVEYLYLDLQTCDRCIGTDNVLDEVMIILTPALRLAGYQVEYNKIKVASEQLAKKFKFLSSPTIRVNGRDVCLSVKENNCGCCSDISGTDVDCRVFEYHGETYEVPPKEMLAEAILKTVFGQESSGCSCAAYQLPDNLQRFFDGKKSKQCTCGGSCC